ncbi:hypothetical protein [Vibrio sp. 99-8-1]|uniref:hypothetical protein n=1 Tax=Vibrio sp. 99-8-1 TaxID=2607602 RepID=UPI0014934533|nr:hypothetical protein [Vibrio sp. 99-8-1]
MTFDLHHSEGTNLMGGELNEVGTTAIYETVSRSCPAQLTAVNQIAQITSNLLENG